MRLKQFAFINLLLPICLLGFTASYITILHGIFNENTRWLIFATLLFYLISRRNVISFLDPLFGLILSLYLGWCFLTSFWSDVPFLSFLKSTMFCVVVITMIRAGIEWVKMHSWRATLNYLGLIAFIFLSTSFFGKTRIDPLQNIKFADGNLHNYQGLVSGSNMLGFMMAAILPLLFWKTYQEWSNGKKRLIFLFLLLSSLYFLGISVARSSYLCALCVFAGFIFSLQLNKKITFLIAGSLAAIAFFLISPASIMNLDKYFYKNTASHDVFHTRHAVWNKSYEAAQEGGWVGLGYGVSWGQTDFDLDHGLTSSFYSREKGNSQLAIVEETGIVGLILYGTLLLVLLGKLGALYISVSNEERVLVGIIAGTFLGMIVTSIFEGWWDAAGGPESAYFWTLVGIIKGLEIVIQGRKKHAASKIETNVRGVLAGSV